MRKSNEDQFGPANSEIQKTIMSKCGMHLGVNLRTAQVAGIQEHRKSITQLLQEDNCELNLEEMCDQETTTREYQPIDSNVHAFCKLADKLVLPNMAKE